MTSLESNPTKIRETILELLSTSENASFSSAATKACLVSGDEYVDLQNLHLGVQRMRGRLLPSGEVLARKVVYIDTWRAVLRLLNDALN